MLVLGRKAGESVVIGDVEVHVVRTGKTTIRLGIVAPKSRQVLRSELLRKQKATSEPAAKVA